MLARYRTVPVSQVSGRDIAILSEILRDGVNLAVWQRELSEPVTRFTEALLSRQVMLSEYRVLELRELDGLPPLTGLFGRFEMLPGATAFLNDVAGLVSAFAYLLDARRIGLRLRILDKPMCPRFHVDHVSVRLITSYAGAGTEWLQEDQMHRRDLGKPDAEPSDAAAIHRAMAGEVLIAKGERWVGNEGGGLIHRSPQSFHDRRLLLTLDWLA